MESSKNIFAKRVENKRLSERLYQKVSIQDLNDTKIVKDIFQNISSNNNLTLQLTKLRDYLLNFLYFPKMEEIQLLFMILQTSPENQELILSIFWILLNSNEEFSYDFILNESFSQIFLNFINIPLSFYCLCKCISLSINDNSSLVRYIFEKLNFITLFQTIPLYYILYLSLSLMEISYLADQMIPVFDLIFSLLFPSTVDSGIIIPENLLKCPDVYILNYDLFPIKIDETFNINYEILRFLNISIHKSKKLCHEFTRIGYPTSIFQMNSDDMLILTQQMDIMDYICSKCDGGLNYFFPTSFPHFQKALQVNNSNIIISSMHILSQMTLDEKYHPFLCNTNLLLTIWKKLDEEIGFSAKTIILSVFLELLDLLSLEVFHENEDGFIDFLTSIQFLNVMGDMITSFSFNDVNQILTRSLIFLHNFAKKYGKFGHLIIDNDQLMSGLSEIIDIIPSDNNAFKICGLFLEMKNGSSK